MKKIPISNRTNLFALVDDDVFEEASKHSWTMQSGGYIRTWIKSEMIYLHRFIMKPDGDQEIDHKDLDKLNCQRENMRACSRAQNNCNKGKRSNTVSEYKGVTYDKSRGKYLARITAKGKGKNLGRFSDPKDAARAYNEAAQKEYGEFARLNIL